MTQDDKIKCSELWQMASGEYIAPRDWTDRAGDELAKFFASVHGCSGAMAYVPSPVGSVPGYGWLVTHVYNVLKNHYNLNKGLIFEGCFVVGIGQFRSAISAECLE